MTVDGYTLGVARQSQQSAANWKAYAEELERKLATYAANYADMEALKNAAIAELSRVDPSNYLTVQPNRQRILDAARAEALQRTKT
ncbi:conserved hypothetical protein [Burkholderia sp. 8Y]|uniref:hypothetical protein n=1 Tax=Burkholderia sp. 8Y TaxID=2653133 RepID=UPI0012F38E8E|nr:hypothetical protein [Burkholderia sp. 8Y]VXC89858.1 conserved hypothetical protein [Burkholderia sp. 8Y]